MNFQNSLDKLIFYLFKRTPFQSVDHLTKTLFARFLLIIIITITLLLLLHIFYSSSLPLPFSPSFFSFFTFFLFLSSSPSPPFLLLQPLLFLLFFLFLPSSSSSSISCYKIKKNISHLPNVFPFALLETQMKNKTICQLFSSISIV